MFRTLHPAIHSSEDLKELARINDNNIGGMTSSDDKQTPEDHDPRDDEENTGISAGYTYLGQFIDHDLTFDPSTLAQQKSDPDAIVDFRTPRFDLDNMYGRGPDDQPYLYDFQNNGTIKMLLGKKLTGSPDEHTRDLPRNNPEHGGRAYALIGDKRNDENVIVSQIQGMFLRFHNRMVDYHLENGLDTSFAAVQQAVQFHYQWMILHDFLPTIIGKDMVHTILPHLENNTNVLTDKPNLLFYNWKNDPFMPVEFSVAAYRFGHSMVRPIYRLNTTMKDRRDVFPDLLAFGEFNSAFAIDWKLFFDFGEAAYTSDPDQPDRDVQFTKYRIQPAYKIDTSLVNHLSKLPPPITGEIPPSLAWLNLIRGVKLKLPSGQSVARAMGITPLKDEQLPVGKANTDGMLSDDPTKKNKIITDISKNFAGNAPLWFYVLAESQQHAFEKAKQAGTVFTNDTPITLGPVGGRIVGEVFAGLLYGDPSSVLNHPMWKPYPDFLINGKFGMVELLTQAQKALPVTHV